MSDFSGDFLKHHYVKVRYYIIEVMTQSGRIKSEYNFIENVERNSYQQWSQSYF